MKRYETVVILDPDLSEDQRRPVFDRVGELIPQQGGQLVKFEEWGVRKLAYPIKKKPRGHYTIIDFCGGGPLVSEMERFFRIDDRVLKFMTVLTDPEIDAEALQRETEGEPEAEAEPEASEAAEAEAGSEPETQAEAEAPKPESAEAGDAAQKEV
jgi:small subunit ribosomal protein S6